MADNPYLQFKTANPYAQFVQPPAAAPASTGVGMAKSFGTGIEQGAIGLAGQFGDAAQTTSDLLSGGAKMLGLPEWAQTAAGGAGKAMMGPLAMAPTTQALTSATEAVTGPMYKPQGVPEQYANTLGQFAPAALLGPGKMAQKATAGLVGALASETAGQVSDPSIAPYTRTAAAIAGGLTPSMMRRAATPFPIGADRQALLDTLKNEGVDLTAGQTTGNQALKYAESELGGGKIGHINETQGSQFTKAALSRAGIDATHATPDVMDHAFTKIGKQFDTLAARNTLLPDHQLATDTANHVKDYTGLLAPSQQAPIVGKLAADLVDAAEKGMTGAQYQNLSSRLGTLSRKAGDADLKLTIGDMKHSLDNAMERSLVKTNSPDVGAWKNTRRQYRNMLVLEQAASGAGENAAQGIISPAQLKNAAMQKQGKRGYVRGQGDFADLARAGEAIMKPLPQSGTAPRTAMRNITAALPTIVGAGAGMATGIGPVFGGLLGAATPSALGRLLLSKPVSAYLKNQRFADGVPMSLSQHAARSALLGHAAQLGH